VCLLHHRFEQGRDEQDIGSLRTSNGRGKWGHKGGEKEKKKHKKKKKEEGGGGGGRWRGGEGREGGWVNERRGRGTGCGGIGAGNEVAGWYREGSEPCGVGLGGQRGGSEGGDVWGRVQCGVGGRGRTG